MMKSPLLAWLRGCGGGLAAVLTSRVLIGCQDGIDAAVGASSDVVVVDLPSSFGDHEYEYEYDDDDKMMMMMIR